MAFEKKTCLPMNSAPNVSASQERQGIARVDRQSSILRLDILPFAGAVVLNLKSGNRLAEEECPGAEIW